MGYTFTMKKNILPPLALGLSFLCSTPLWAVINKTVQTDQLFLNTLCQKTDSCDLQQFGIYVEDAEIISSSFGTNYSTNAFLSYQTTDTNNLQKYGIVQFIRGCQFDSDAEGNIRYGYSREFFGKIVQFRHPKWVIDSVDVDPLYNSDDTEGRPRHALYRWNEIPGSYDKGSEHYFYQETPSLPLLYVKDRPGTAFYDDDYKEAKNISLEFKACIYKIEDIPLVSHPDGMDFNKALHCFDWRSSYIYNHQLAKYQSPNQVSPICTE